MLRYLTADIYTKEIPDELSLGITILGCPIHCKNCHSSHVWDINSEDSGTELTTEVFNTLLNPLSSCVLFFGGDWDPDSLKDLLIIAKDSNYKTALYTGYNHVNNIVIPYLDYAKVGPYIEELGGLTSKATNQRLYTIKNGIFDEDITYKFWS